MQFNEEMRALQGGVKRLSEAGWRERRIFLFIGTVDLQLFHTPSVYAVYPQQSRQERMAFTRLENEVKRGLHQYRNEFLRAAVLCYADICDDMFMFSVSGHCIPLIISSPLRGEG